ncbi:hypothetical protein JOQ06_030082 [Pogonophryne albipinna]|uniref:glycerol-3-phosphate dehydrogenase n=1 Tax=Pogonophryne albipinna TaxID=1090488 RepID=A0AAD6AYW3_9TELE|nr:hypothetical protein JOQ06_030082 [Pogonophryne albipinna]
MAVMGTAVSATGALCAFDSLTQLEEYKRKQACVSHVEAAEQVKNVNTDELRIQKLPEDLKTALVRGDDFSSGSSSRSTKLIHRGVRYLQKAIMKLDYKQNPSFTRSKPYLTQLSSVKPEFNAIIK